MGSIKIHIAYVNVQDIRLGHETELKLEDLKKVLIDEIREEAWAEGMQEGEEKGVARLNKLNSLLLAANRLSDLQRTLQDPEYQKQLFQEFGI